jgi:hypothetical protein
MTLGDINTKVLALTHADTTSYPDATMLIDINMWYQKIVSMIFESQDDTDFDDQRNTNYPIVTTPMVAAQRDYAIPVSEQVLKIKRVDITYDGTNYYRATPFDNGVAQWGMGNAANEDSNFIQASPQYDVQYNSIFIYPLPTAANVSAGGQIRIEWERAVTPFSQSADYNAAAMSTSVSVPGIDLPWHPMIAYGAAYEFANANNLPQLGNIKQDLVDWEARLRVAYGRKDLDTQMALRPAYDSYGDYGSTGAGGYSYGR